MEIWKRDKGDYVLRKTAFKKYPRLHSNDFAVILNDFPKPSHCVCHKFGKHGQSGPLKNSASAASAAAAEAKLLMHWYRKLQESF